MHKRYHQYNDTYVEVFYEPELVNGKREGKGNFFGTMMSF